MAVLLLLEWRDRNFEWRAKGFVDDMVIEMHGLLMMNKIKTCREFLWREQVLTCRKRSF